MLNNPLIYIDPSGHVTLYSRGGAGGFLYGRGSARISGGVVIKSPESGWFGTNYLTIASEKSNISDGTKSPTHGAGLGAGFEFGFFTGNESDFRGSAVNFTVSFFVAQITYSYNGTNWGLCISTGGKGSGAGVYMDESKTKTGIPMELTSSILTSLFNQEHGNDSKNTIEALGFSLLSNTDGNNDRSVLKPHNYNLGIDWDKTDEDL